MSSLPQPVPRRAWHYRQPGGPLKTACGRVVRLCARVTSRENEITCRRCLDRLALGRLRAECGAAGKEKP